MFPRSQAQQAITPSPLQSNDGPKLFTAGKARGVGAATDLFSFAPFMAPSFLVNIFQVALSHILVDLILS